MDSDMPVIQLPDGDFEIDDLSEIHIQIVPEVDESQSKIWEHFDKPVNGRSLCKLCSKSYSCYGTSSSNLHKHLLTHKVIVDKLKKTTPQSKEKNKSTRTGSMKKCDQEACDMLLVSLLCRDYLPFSLVESLRFKKFVAALNSNYRLPSRAAISHIMVPKIYQQLHEKIRQSIDNATDVCLTCDGWTSLATESFIAVTAHYLSPNLSLQSAAIGVAKIVDQSTGGHVEAIKIVLDEYPGLENKVRLMVTDGAPVMKSTAVTMGFQWLHCFPHRLNLVVRDALRITAVNNLILQVRTVVSHFRKSAKSTAALRATLESNNLVPLKLVRDVDTRWSSTFNMLDRYLKIATHVAITMLQLQLTFDPPGVTECQELGHIRDLLKPFAVVTGELSAESYVHASEVIYLSSHLQKSVKEFLARFDVGADPTIKLCKTKNGTSFSFAQGLRAAMLERDFSSLSSDQNLSLATLLDPRLKTYAFGTLTPGSPGETARQALYRAAARVDAPPVVNSQATLERVVTDSIWEELEHRKSLANDLRPVLEARVEVERYLSDSPVPLTLEIDGRQSRNDPLMWWKTRQLQYPRLYVLALRYLSLMMNSVPCERLFSKMGLIITDRRSSLKPEKAAIIAFVASNFDKLYEA